MRYITEAELREQFSSGLPACYELPSGCMLTPSARQYLMDLKLYQQGTGRQGPQAAHGSSKPEHMTHLNSREMVYKTHPRILLRGKLDTLESEILLVMVGCGETWRALLQDALMLVRQVFQGRWIVVDEHQAPVLGHGAQYQLKETAHQLHQHRVVRGFGDGQMELGVRAGCACCIARLLVEQHVVKAVTDAIPVLGCGALGRSA